MTSDIKAKISRIKVLKEDFASRQVGHDRILVPVRQNMSDFNAMFTLNATAAFLWNQLDDAAALTDLVDALQGQYEVGEKTAGEDAYSFIEALYAYMTSAGEETN